MVIYKNLFQVQKNEYQWFESVELENSTANIREQVTSEVKQLVEVQSCTSEQTVPILKKIKIMEKWLAQLRSRVNSCQSPNIWLEHSLGGVSDAAACITHWIEKENTN